MTLAYTYARFVIISCDLYWCLFINAVELYSLSLFSFPFSFPLSFISLHSIMMNFSSRLCITQFIPVPWIALPSSSASTWFQPGGSWRRSSTSVMCIYVWMCVYHHISLFHDRAQLVTRAGLPGLSIRTFCSDYNVLEVCWPTRATALWLLSKQGIVLLI